MQEFAAAFALIWLVVSVIVVLIVAFWMWRVLSELKEISKEMTAFNECAERHPGELLASIRSLRNT